MVHFCVEPGCSKQATHGVVNTRNKLWCGLHAIGSC